MSEQTKWKAYKDTFAKDGWYIEAEHSKTPPNKPYTEFAYAYSKEIADKIVQAVNYHDELIKKLEFLIIHCYPMEDNPENYYIKKQHINDTRALLRRIEEGNK